MAREHQVVGHGEAVEKQQLALVLLALDQTPEFRAVSQSSARLLHATLRVLSLSSRDPAHPVRPSALPKPRSDRNGCVANCGKHKPRTTNCNRQPQRLINLGNLRDRAPE